MRAIWAARSGSAGIVGTDEGLQITFVNDRDDAAEVAGFDHEIAGLARHPTRLSVGYPIEMVITDGGPG